MAFLCARVLGKGPGIDLGCPGGSPRMVLGRILLEFVARILFKVWSKFGPHFRSVGVPSSVLPLTRPALQLKGRRSRGAL